MGEHLVNIITGSMFFFLSSKSETPVIEDDASLVAVRN